jgi:hypothetical protein
MSSEDMKVGNQNQVLNDYKQLEQKNVGAIDKAVQDMNNLKTPTVGGGGGSDGFNVMTDMMAAKAGPVGFMAQLHADLGLNQGVENSAFFGGGGGGRPRDKKSAALAAKIRMLMSNSNPVTGKLSRQQNLALWREVRREMSGVGNKSKNPMMGGGSGFNSFSGEKTAKGPLKKFPTKADLLNNTHLLENIGLGEIKQNLDTIHYSKNHRTLFEDITGTEMGWEEAKASLKTQQKDEVIRIASTMPEERRDVLVQDVLSAEHYLMLKIQEGKAQSHEQTLRREEEDRLGREREQAEERKRQRELAQHAAAITPQPAAPEPPKPTWSPAPLEKEKSKEDSESRA